MATTKTSKPTKAVPPAKPATASVKASPSQEPAKAKSSSGPTPEQIQVRAFEIYVSEGCKEGSDLENWLRAEKELRGK